MLLSSSLSTLLGHYTFEEAVDLMHDTGFEACDFGFFNKAFYNEESDNAEFRQKLVDLRKHAEDKGMIFNQAHSPFPSSSQYPVDMEELFQNIVRTIKYSSLLGIKITVVHPIKYIGDKDHYDPEELFEANMEFYNQLKPYCEEYNVKVALENMWRHHYDFSGKSIAKVRSSCGTPDEFIKYLDELNSEWFVGCLDIGHALLLREDPADFIRALGGKRLKSLHIHDVDGAEDNHTIPYYGGMANWDSIALALKEIGYEGDFTLEAGAFLKPLPKELFPNGLKFMADVSKHIMKKIQ